MKFKSCVLASILGLINFIPGNVNAQFVENQNYPYFFNQADHLEEGLWWFKSRTNPEEVFFIVAREHNEISQKKSWDFVCGRDHKFFNQFKKYYYQILHIDSTNRRIIPDDLQKDENEFYKFLYTNYSRATTRTGTLPANLLYDNPLDNSGWFYRGFGTNDLEARVRENKIRIHDKNSNTVNMFAVNTGNSQKGTAFRKYENRFCEHSDLENLINYFKDNVYLQHGQGESTEIIDNYENLKKLGLLGKNPYTKNKDLPLQNQKHVFFSLVMPGRENLNQYSDSDKFHKFFHMDNKRFLNLPLVSGSLDMGRQVLGCKCFIGKSIDVLTNIVLVSEYTSRHCGIEYYFSTPSEYMNKTFTEYEIRIPTYIFADRWFDKTPTRGEIPSDNQLKFEQECDDQKYSFSKQLPKYGS